MISMDCGCRLYFGVLGRDFAEVASDRMVSHTNVVQLSLLLVGLLTRQLYSLPLAHAGSCDGHRAAAGSLSAQLRHLRR